MTLLLFLIFFGGGRDFHSGSLLFGPVLAVCATDEKKGLER